MDDLYIVDTVTGDAIPLKDARLVPGNDYRDVSGGSRVEIVDRANAVGEPLADLLDK